MKYIILFLTFSFFNVSALKSCEETYLLDPEHKKGGYFHCLRPVINIFRSIFWNAPYASELALTNLVESRLNNETLINSVVFKFSGNGQLHDYHGRSLIKGNAPVYKLFAPKGLPEEIRKLTTYEKLEIFLDTVFGLKRHQEGCPPPHLQNGNIATLLQHKFDFVLGSWRIGFGYCYGHMKTKNHFSDHPDSNGHFPGTRGGMGITDVGTV